MRLNRLRIVNFRDFFQSLAKQNLGKLNWADLLSKLTSLNSLFRICENLSDFLFIWSLSKIHKTRRWILER